MGEELTACEHLGIGASSLFSSLFVSVLFLVLFADISLTNEVYKVMHGIATNQVVMTSIWAMINAFVPRHSHEALEHSCSEWKD